MTEPAQAIVAPALGGLRLAHRALPGRDLADVDLTTPLLGATLAAPVVLTAVAGDHGSAQLAARVASEHGFGLVLGGGRGLPDDPIAEYRAPLRPPLLLAGIRLSELRGPDGPARAERLTAMLDADGLAIELDPIGEALDPAGDASYGDAEAVIVTVVERLAPAPVVVRAPRCGMEAADVRVLRAAGVAAVEVCGPDEAPAPFDPWGVPPADAIAEGALVAPELPVLAGGRWTGVEVATCLALGAAAAALPWPVDPAALVQQLRVAVWAAGAPAAGALTPGHLRA